MINPNIVIKQLKKKIRHLQTDLSERTRNFLVHNGLKTSIFVDKSDQMIQTDSPYLQNSNYSECIKRVSPTLQSYQYGSQLKQQNKLKSKVILSEFLTTQKEQSSEIRQIVSQIIQQLSQQQKINEQKQQITSTSDDFQYQNSQTQIFDREKRRLKRQIKKLTSKLEFQQKINLIAKEGHLISQQENYQFRLKIMELIKQKELQNEKPQEHSMIENSDLQNLKNEIANLQIDLNNQRQLKQQYLETTLQLEDEINKLKQENSKLKNILGQIIQNQKELDQFSQSISYEKEGIIDPQILEKIKNCAFSISNCIPVTHQLENINYFRPQSDSQILQALQRAELYCKQIQRWQLQRLNIIQKQKKLFIYVLNKISEHIDNKAKINLVSQLMKIQQISHYMTLFVVKEQKTQPLIIQQFRQELTKIQSNILS